MIMIALAATDVTKLLQTPNNNDVQIETSLQLDQLYRMFKQLFAYNEKKEEVL